MFEGLALPALAMCAIAACVCAPATLWLWRRSLRLSVSAAPGEAPGAEWSINRRVPMWLARRPLDRSLIQFFLAVVWRSLRHRLASLTAAGLVMAVTLEGTLVLMARVATNSRWLTEFAVPILVMLCLLTVFRWLLTLPAELPASWVVGTAMPIRGALVRRAVGRLLLVLCVVPAALIACALSWWQGGLLSAVAHGAVVLVAGLGLIEYALTKVTFVPFVTEYLAGRSNLKARWPIHVAVLLFVVPAVAQIERALVATPGMTFVVAMAIAMAGLAFVVGRRRARTDLLNADPGTGADWTTVELKIGYLHPKPYS